MGVSAAEIFADDVAIDIRELWTNAFRETGSAAKATATVRSELKDAFGDMEDGPVAALALALTLWKHGHLDDVTKKRAVSVIEKGKGLERWRERGPSAERARLKEYAKVKLRLMGRQPPAVIRKPKPVRVDDSGLRSGHIFSIPVRGSPSGRCFFQVIGLEKDRTEVRPVVQLLDVPAQANPDKVNWIKAKRIGFRNYTNNLGFHVRFFAQVLHGWNARAWDRKSLTLHGRAKIPAAVLKERKRRYISGIGWEHLAGYIVPSLDRSVWMTHKDLHAEFCALSPDQIRTARASVERYCSQGEGARDPCAWIANRLIHAQGDYARALAVLDLATTVDAVGGYDILRGHALLGLGRDREAQKCFAEATRSGIAYGRKVPAMNAESIREAREEVAARLAGRPLPVPANLLW